MNEKRNFRILVADNDLVFLEIAERKLSQRGFNVFVSTLDKAVEAVQRVTFDFIFMDQNKTESEGAALVRLTETLASKPVIQFFGSDFKESAQEHLFA